MKNLVIILGVIALINSNDLKAQDMKNTNLDTKQQKIATIAINTAIGDLSALKTELAAGLDAGLTINEIKEVLVQLYAYCGFPRSLQGINTFMTLLEERTNQGINDKVGEEGVMVRGENKYQQGKETLQELTQMVEKELTGANAFAPAIDVFLKEHLFADIFGRGVLSYSNREMATVSALIGLGGVDPMLQSHLNMSINTGLSEAQLREVIQAVAPFAGSEKTRNAEQILFKVVESRN